MKPWVAYAGIGVTAASACLMLGTLLYGGERRYNNPHSELESVQKYRGFQFAVSEIEGIKRGRARPWLREGVAPEVDNFLKERSALVEKMDASAESAVVPLKKEIARLEAEDADVIAYNKYEAGTDELFWPTIGTFGLFGLCTFGTMALPSRIDWSKKGEEGVKSVEEIVTSKT